MSAAPPPSDAPARRLLVSHAQADAFAPHARSILSRTGYRIVGVEELAGLPPSMADRRPDLRIVDERRLGELPDDGDAGSVPIILLTGRHGVSGVDPRIVGAVPRPAGLHELYRVVQSVLEENPRSTPRVATHIPAHCRKEGREWTGTILSLSENGCLLRCVEPVPLRSDVEIEFALPRAGNVVTPADVAYQLPPDLGLVFHSTPAAVRRAVAEFVLESVARFPAVHDGDRAPPKVPGQAILPRPGAPRATGRRSPWPPEPPPTGGASISSPPRRSTRSSPTRSASS